MVFKVQKTRPKWRFGFTAGGLLSAVGSEFTRTAKRIQCALANAQLSWTRIFVCILDRLSGMGMDQGDLAWAC